MPLSPTATVGPIKGGISVAQNTFTVVRGLVLGSSAAAWNTATYPTLPMPFLNEGSTFDVEAWGVASNTATPTIILGLYYGTINDPVTTSPAILAVSTAKTTTTAMSNWEWHAYYTGRVVSHGTSTTGGSIIGSGYWKLPTALTSWTEVRWPETAPAAVAADTTINKALAIGVTWGASSSSNTITLQGFRVRVDP